MRTLSVVIVMMLLPAGAAMAQITHTCFVGYAYHLETGEFVYTETHRQTLKDGDPVTWDVTYRDPQGDTIAVKNMNFTDHPFVPVYRLKILGEGYVEGISHDGGWVMYRRANSGADRATEAFTIEAPIAGDSGFHPFVQAHFDALMRGETVAFSFVVSGRLSVISMEAKRVRKTTFEGEPAVVFRAGLATFFINWFVDPIILVYDPDTERLLEYRGISNLHGPDGETFPVRVSYYSEPPPQAQQAAGYCGDATSG